MTRSLVQAFHRNRTGAVFVKDDEGLGAKFHMVAFGEDIYVQLSDPYDASVTVKYGAGESVQHPYYEYEEYANNVHQARSSERLAQDILFHMVRSTFTPDRFVG